MSAPERGVAVLKVLTAHGDYYCDPGRAPATHVAFEIAEAAALVDAVEAARALSVSLTKGSGYETLRAFRDALARYDAARDA